MTRLFLSILFVVTVQISVIPTQSRSNSNFLESVIENKIRSWAEDWAESWADAWANSWNDSWTDAGTNSWADSWTNTWENFITHPDTVDQTGDAWKVYDDKTAIAGKDICDKIERYHSSMQKLPRSLCLIWRRELKYNCLRHCQLNIFGIHFKSALSILTVTK